MRTVNFGIDLGTTNSLVAKYDNGKVVVFKNPNGFKETLASVVAYRPDRILIGDKAREYLTKDSINVFGGFKRKMGTDEKYYVVNIDENVTPIELSSLVLKELKKFIPPDESLEACVITIPAFFDSMQSNATMKAGKEAGFQEIFLLQEPIAACLAFFNSDSNQQAKEGNWLVYDLGGGTYDVALVKSTENELKIIDHEGNNFLGGMDFDFAIIKELILPEIIRQTGIENFEEEFRVKYGKYEKLYFLILYYAEEAKKELSNSESTYVEFSAEIEGKNFDFEIQITKNDLDRIFQPLIYQTIKLLKEVLTRNKLHTSDINQIILVGGSTYLKQVREMLEREITIPLNYSLDPTTCVAMGAAFYAANKYFKPTESNVLSEVHSDDIDSLIRSEQIEKPDLIIDLNYSKVSRDSEEILLMNVQGDYEGKFFRIVRHDGGFDTGMVAMKSKKTEFLTLLPNMNNDFSFKVFDAESNEIESLTRSIHIAQGVYNIDGQPLPRDICVEVDDIENKTTKLEVIFERNSLLPQKKTLYREISKTIPKGSKESITINILEGEKNSRPSSNLSIGCIEISGKELTSDLVKGSDIEIQIQITESRVLNTKVYLVMTQQEFENVFSMSEKNVNISRLKEQFSDLENGLINTVKEFQYNEDEYWELLAQSLLDELYEFQESLFKLKEKDKSDEKYIIAEKLSRISKEYDKLGGNERISKLIEDYFYQKDIVDESISNADFEKDELRKNFSRMQATESSFMNSRNVSVIENKIKQLNDLYWKALSNTTSFLVERFYEYKNYTEIDFKDYRAAKSLLKLAEGALENNRMAEFRRLVYSISAQLRLVNYNFNQDFKGTGIG